MTEDELSKQVEIAEAVAGKVKDDANRAVTYKYVLKSLLGLGSGVLGAPTPAVAHARQGASAGSHITTGSGGPLEKVAAWLGMPIEEVTEFLEFQDEGVRLAFPLSKVPHKLADGQRFLALIKLAVDKVGYGADSAQAKTIIAICKEYSCHDANFAANIKDRDDLIETTGVRGAMKVYKIRRAGLEEAKKELANAYGLQSN